jgi:hypothetical protein
MVIYDACYVLTYVAVMLGSQLTNGSYAIQESDCRQIHQLYVSACLFVSNAEREFYTNTYVVLWQTDIWQKPLVMLCPPLLGIIAKRLIAQRNSWPV